MAIDADITIITRAEAKAFLKIPVATTSEDDTIDFLVDAANELVHTYTGRKFVSTTYTEHYDGTGASKLILKEYPVVSITSVHSDSNRDFGADSLLSADDYIIDKKSGILTLWNGESHFSSGVRNVKVVYVAGYAAGDMPYDLKHAAKLIVATIYRRQFQDQRFGLLSETVGERTMTYANEDIPKMAAMILNRYRRMGQASYGHTA